MCLSYFELKVWLGTVYVYKDLSQSKLIDLFIEFVYLKTVYNNNRGLDLKTIAKEQLKVVSMATTISSNMIGRNYRYHSDIYKCKPYDWFDFALP